MASAAASTCLFLIVAFDYLHLGRALKVGVISSSGTWNDFWLINARAESKNLSDATGNNHRIPIFKPSYPAIGTPKRPLNR